MGGRGLGAGATFLWTRDTWIALHTLVGVALLLVVIVHLMLHRKWILRMTKRLGGKKG